MMSDRSETVITEAASAVVGFRTGYLARAVLDALKAARIAVVELPAPSYVDDPDGNLEPGGKGFNSDDPRLGEHGVYAFGGQVFDQYDGWSPADARVIASWWLAAADAAEESQS